jgi:hypothetical protein
VFDVVLYSDLAWCASDCLSLFGSTDSGQRVAPPAPAVANETLTWKSRLTRAALESRECSERGVTGCGGQPKNCSITFARLLAWAAISLQQATPPADKFSF